ncbi:TrmJ/YjtD family RNA methyltransferase [Nanoarchaeota archaeon]
MINIVLLEPKNAGNIGAICRVIANFDLNKLIIINPKCDIKDIELIKRAKHSKTIIKNILIKPKSYLKKFDYLIGTTAKLGSDYNIPRSPTTPRKLAEKIVKRKSNIAILFGREDLGLSNEEIKMCDYITSIPSSKKYRTLNISHAVSIICYEIFLARSKNIFNEYAIAGKPEKDALLKKINKILNQMDFSTKEKKETQKIVWKKLLGKGMLTKREIFSLHGFFEKLKP